MLTALLLAATLSPFDQVVAAERAFAASSLQIGRDEAFLQNLADDAITFLPLPAPARPTHTGQKRDSGELSWGPAWVAVSAGGDLAVSTGPWQLVPPENPVLKQVVTGWFVSIWRRQPGGAWKVAVDAGVSASIPFAIPKTAVNGFASVKAPKEGDAAQADAGIKEVERAYDAAAQSRIGEAVLRFADPLVRVYRENAGSAVGPAEARTFLASDKRKASCATDKIVVSASGDLGYSYGICTELLSEAPTKHGFLHVWRLQADGSWKLLIDVTP